MNVEIPFTGMDCRTDASVVQYDRAILIYNAFTERDTVKSRPGYRLMRGGRITGTEQVITTVTATYPSPTQDEQLAGIIAGREQYSPYRDTP